MIKIPQVKGAIFDVDDTLLDNFADGTGIGLHERSRLMAVHEVGKLHAIDVLRNFTMQQCIDAFLDAKEHTLQAAVWQMLVMAGEVSDDAIDSDNKLLVEIMTLKDLLHEKILRTEGKEISGAVHFISQLSQNGLKGRLA